MNTDETRIRALLAERETAMRKKDPEAVVAQYAPGAVVYDLAPPLRHNGSEVEDPEGLRAWFAGFDGPMDYEIRDPAITVGGDIAYSYSLNRLTATPQGTPSSFDLWFRATVCLRRIDGEWLIAHEHTSTPFYMDGSFRAALDLQP